MGGMHTADAARQPSVRHPSAHTQMGWQEKATLEGVGLGEGGSDLV